MTRKILEQFAPFLPEGAAPNDMNELAEALGIPSPLKIKTARRLLQCLKGTRSPQAGVTQFLIEEAVMTKVRTPAGVVLSEPDASIAGRLGVSRQHVNRIRQRIFRAGSADPQPPMPVSDWPQQDGRNKSNPGSGGLPNPNTPTKKSRATYPT